MLFSRSFPFVAALAVLTITACSSDPTDDESQDTGVDVAADAAADTAADVDDDAVADTSDTAGDVTDTDLDVGDSGDTTADTGADTGDTSVDVAVDTAGDVDTDSGTDVAQCPDGDADGDGVCDDADVCPGADDLADADEDGAICADDCDDNDAGARPGAVWYPDGDGDGYYADGATQIAAGCERPADVVAASTGGDCADDDANVHPNAVELCDTVDSDCDGFIDDAVGVAFVGDEFTVDLTAEFTNEDSPADWTTPEPGDLYLCEVDVFAQIHITNYVRIVGDGLSSIDGGDGPAIELAGDPDNVAPGGNSDPNVVNITNRVVLRGAPAVDCRYGLWAGNDVELRGSAGADTAGLVASSCTLNFDNVRIEAFVSTGQGGGLSITDGTQLEVLNSRVRNSVAASGGGMYCESSSVAGSSLSFIGNLATSSGGGVYADDCAFAVDALSFNTNRADGPGGGIYATSTTLTGSQYFVDANSASGSGAGMWLGDNSQANLSLVFLRDNVQDTALSSDLDGGGGLALVDSSMDAAGFLAEDNTANAGGAVMIGPGNASLTVTGDCDVNGNTARGLDRTAQSGGIVTGGGVWLRSGGLITSSCDWTDGAAQGNAPNDVQVYVDDVDIADYVFAGVGATWCDVLGCD